MSSIPEWNALHPLVVHFPIALLLVAPLLAVIGLVVKRQRAFLFAALVLMALGTAGAWLAVATGEAAGKLVESLPGVEDVVEHHGEMAETTATLFTVLTLVYGVLLLAHLALRWQPRRIRELTAHGAFLAVYAAAAVYLTQTAHLGGLLVHQHGVHATVGQGAPAVEAGAREADESDERGHRD
jgi:uncharacterized membrane protein